MIKYKLSAILIAMLATKSFASVVRGDVDYQYFRDFAENKGEFVVGAKNVPYYNKQGQLLGTILPKDIPMPDFQSVEKNRYLAGLVSPQYLTSVKHNTDNHFLGVHFDSNNDSGLSAYNYRVVDRNDHTTLDYNTPRLNKMVTEVAPAELPTQFSADDFTNGRYIAFARAGTGRQAIKNNRQINIVANAYTYPTGGQPIRFSHRVGELITTPKVNIDETFLTYASPGDSGSPVYGFDKDLKRWVLIGNAVHWYNFNAIRNDYIATQSNFIEARRNEDVGLSLNVRSTQPIHWQDNNDGTSTLSSEINRLTLDVASADGNNLNHGKDMIIKGRYAKFTLDNDINQGAGGLYFLTSGEVSGKGTYLGSGVFVDENQTVKWRVNNPQGDRMSKLGKGHLIVDGQGLNQGAISIGDGKVTLNATKGRAFESAHLASGRGTLTLGAENQVDRMIFGVRGGKFDLNGHNFTFANGILHQDDGATITNDNLSQTSTVTISSAKENDEFKGSFGEKPKYLDLVYTPDLNLDDLDLTPIDITDSGRLNVHYQPKTDNSRYILSGGMNIAGDVLVDKGELQLQGRPTPHAYDMLNHKAVIGDWQSRVFTAENMNVFQSGKLTVGRNVEALNSNFNLKNNATLNLGIVDGETEQCIDRQCTKIAVNDDFLKTIPLTTVQGDIDLKDNARVNLGTVGYKGTILGSGNSLVNLSNHSHWILTGNSTVQHLNIDKGGIVQLNPQNEYSHFNTLTVNGNLTGAGLFKFSSSLAQLQANKLIVNGQVSGEHIISIQDSGKEPDFARFKNDSSFQLISVTQPQKGNYKFKLEKGYVDAGAYRYVLNDNLTVSSDVLNKQIADYKAGKVVEVEKSNPVTPAPEPEFDLSKYWNPNFDANNELKRAVYVIAKENNFRALSHEEVVAALIKHKVLKPRQISASTDIDANDPLVGRTIYLDTLTAEDKALLDSLQDDMMGPDTIKVEDWTDNTPKPKPIEDVNVDDKASLAEFGEDASTTPSSTSESSNQNSSKTDNHKKETDTNNSQGSGNNKGDTQSPTKMPNTTSTATNTATSMSDADKTMPIVELVKATGKTQAEVMSDYANDGVLQSATTLRQASHIGQMVTLNAVSSNVKAPKTVWVSYTTGTFNAGKNTNDYRGQKQTHYTTQLGVEKAVNDNTLLGAVLTQQQLKAKENQSHFDSNTGKHKGLIGSLYGKYQWDNGAFVIGQTDFGKLHKQSLWQLGATVGMDFNIGQVKSNNTNNKSDSATITPFAGLTYHHIAGKNWNNSNGADIRFDTARFVSYHAGVKANYTLNTSIGQFKPYVQATVVNANKTRSVHVNNATFTHKFDRKATYTGGVEWAYKQASVNLSVDRDVKLQLGFSW